MKHKTTQIEAIFVDYIPWIGSLATFILRSVKNDYEELLIKLAADIKTARVGAGLSQEALALAAEVDRSYVSQLERGVANPSLLILHRLAKVLGVDVQIRLTNVNAVPSAKMH